MAYAISRLLSKEANSEALIRDNTDKATLAVDAVLVVSLVVTSVVLIALSASGVSLGALSSIGIAGHGVWVLGAASLPIILADTVVVLFCLNKSRQSQKQSRVAVSLSLEDVSSAQRDLYAILFTQIFTQQTLASTDCLGDKIEEVAEKLQAFNSKYSTNLGVRGSQHSGHSKDPWQTIKITDNSITTPGETSDILVGLNDLLHSQYGVQSNGGDNGRFAQGQKKRDPQCFIKNGVLMNPQIQLSRIDIKRVLELTTPNEYFDELQQAYQQ